MDEIRVQGVLGKGYGIIPKMVMQDERLNIEAKAIYSYLSSYAGNGSSAFPGASKIISDLKISEKRFYKYRKQLIETGYVTVQKRRIDNRRDSNLYILNMDIVIAKKEESQHSQFESVQNESVQNESVQNGGTNNNSFNNNNINNNSVNNNNNNSSNCNSIEDFKEAFIHYEKAGMGTISDRIKDFIIDDVKTYGIEWFKDSIDESIKKGKYTLSYAEGILSNWKSKGRNSKSKRGDISGADKQHSSSGLEEGVGL